MNPHYERAMMLAARERHEEAVKELREGLTVDADDPFCHGLLAIELSRLGRHEQAIETARRTVVLAPDFDYSYFVLARVLTERNELKAAREAIQTAIKLDPEDADNFGLLARIEFECSEWAATVSAADQGLALNPKEDVCQHYRSLALARQGKLAEAERGLDTLMSDDPNDPATHDAKGWLCLERRDAARAKEHFLEALRLSPTNDSARSGLANALKSQHVVFGLALQALLLASRHKSWVIWGALIGVFFGLRVLDRFALAHPDFYLAVWAVKATWFTGMILLLVANPLFDLLLRLDKQGRHTLSEAQVRASNLNLFCLLGGLGLGVMWATRGGAHYATLAWAMLSLPNAISAAHASSEGWVRKRMMRVVLLATVLLPISFFIALVGALVLVRTKGQVIWVLKAGVFWLPLISVCISAFADDIAEYFERRRPDPTS